MLFYKTAHIWLSAISLVLGANAARPPFGSAPMRLSPVLPRVITPQAHFDNFSLILEGQRVFLYSGEFHTFRLPVPSLWPDILEKVKAAGLNAVSMYTHMGLINPAPGVVDFSGFRALQPFFDAAKAAGVWVVLRPGPYINAETSAGGLAHWTTSQVAGGTLRTNGTEWHAAWQDYIQGIIEQMAPNQINNGGPVIAIQVDNEYFNEATVPGAPEYFAELEAVYHNSGIDVMLTYNDPGEGMNFINGTGAVDLHGFDEYPNFFDCSTPEVWRGVMTNYHQYHESVNPGQVLYVPEFQGGSLNGWGAIEPGYANCFILTGPDFQSVFNRQLWAGNVKMINYYVFYGGTSWGGIPYPGVYTSYDYGASIHESRALSAKFDELKLQAIFLRSSPDFYKTNWINDSSTGLAATTTNPAAFVTFLQNPDTKSGFYVLRQTDSTSTAITTFKLNITTASAGAIQVPLVVPAITLGGRESKLVLTDYSFGTSIVDYTTAQIFFAGTIGGRDVLFLYGNSTQAHEIRLALTGTPNKAHQTTSSLVSSTPSSNKQTILAFQPGLTGLQTIWDSRTQLVLYADYATATTFWAPVIPASSNFGQYWSIGTNESVLVGGPYLVRKATISGTTLALTGDLNGTAPLTVIAPATVRSVTWNGACVKVSAGVSATGGLVGSLTPRSAVKNVKVPTLTGWRFKDSLPEIQPDFDDSEWTVANHTTTNIPVLPSYGDGRILYGCDYGFCENIVLWRGHFNSTGEPTSVNLSMNGGSAFAASVWLNDVCLNTSFGGASVTETDQKFTFPPGALRTGDNVITIVFDNMGMDEDGGTTPQDPRGVLGFSLDSGSFGEWKVQGKVGGYTGFPDKTRGVLNEGGLFGERKGWHLPGFSTASWTKRDLAAGLPSGSAGVGFFVTTFDLDVPGGVDAFMSFTFEEPLGQDYRAYMFVNGWMMGKRVGNLGPQAKFPVHQGILNFRGTNTVAVALWSMGQTAVSPNLRLVLDGVLDGGVPNVTTNNPAWSPVGRM